MFAEVLGLPASGKTTLWHGINDELGKVGHTSCRIDDLDARDSALPGFIRRNLTPRAIYRLEQFRTDYPDCARLMDELGRGKISAHSLLLATGARYQIYAANPHLPDVVIADEGFLHRAIHLIAQKDDHATETLDEFCRTLPPLDCVVFLSVPPETSFQRAVDRLATRSKGKHSAATIRKRIVKAHGDVAALDRRQKLMNHAVDAMERRGTHIIRLLTDQDPDDIAAQVVAHLQMMLQRTGENKTGA